ncbi:ubiquitin carboxyl-terminal hydrolase [Schizosaccharomyces japonicus yFS275]|uniref:Ubiquitin carboxyl-terminal hydrolase n=1 Tax=Schizosaccharomyces japonicus (strain yFS275 / FY16936) TaxID=402676 RepID=B6K4X2_SCHJY|nr:ubiquitin carboxyl-terminal hydrolase [Schizosaccharomyces japonicus yFS275]EEB08529.2 ubiquitin carboxyl-terminal hydrolase [Schizosaccharomyces japonicus yFS275]
MSNAREPSAQVASATHCRYTKDIPDWGFTRYYDSRKLLVRTGGQTRPIIENGSVLISAHVRVLRDVTGVLWHPLLDYDSKVATGFVGLKNQGATCYMNSLLQSLYIIPAFRRCVYQIPTEDDSPSDSVAYALQRCFYNLEYSKDAVSTIELTKSFGWDSLDSFMQHDVQEFNRVLQDNLEKRMKGTPVEDALTKLFVGKMKSYICCVDVNFESAREEDFWDIQLNVKGMKDMEESFRDYIQVEMLEGDNCYHADTYGLQRARKGVIFESFPPILHIQLKRFEYDFERDMMIKINDRYEFPLEFDASPYMDEAAKTPGQKIQYVLHGVLVHSGDLHAGHYYALLKPGKDDKWFKFDDNRVTPAMLREVLEENYGGDTVVYPPYKPAIKLKRCMSAYMLVYLRKDKIDELFAPIAREEIPQHLRTVLDEEIRIQDEKRKERAESHLYTNVRIVTKSSFAQHHEFDLANFDDPYDAELVPQMRLLKSTKFSDFVTDAAKQFKLGK